MTIGDKIRKVRELKSYKQEYVADRLGMSVTAYGNIERNDSRLSFERLEQIACVLEVSVQDILNIPEVLSLHAVAGVQIGLNHYGPSSHLKEKEGYGSVIGAYRQMVDSLQKDNEYLRHQNTLLMELLAQKMAPLPERSPI